MSFAPKNSKPCMHFFSWNAWGVETQSRIAVLRRCPTLVPHTREIFLFSPRALVKAGFAPPPPRAPEFCPWRTQYRPNQVENLFPACLRSLRGAWSRASRSLRPEPAAACLATRREDRDEREGGPLAVAGAPRSRASSPKVPPNCVLCFVFCLGLALLGGIDKHSRD